MIFRNRNRKSERGNIFFTLFAAVAIVGVLGAAIMATMRGPLATMVEVNRRAQAESQMTIASKLVLLDAVETLTGGGDCDGDGFVEPMEFKDPGSEPAPVGGGLLPDSVGTEKQDPWGTYYGYCVWDAGPVKDDAACDDATVGFNRLDGTEDTAENYTMIAIISAGPDHTFQTTCAEGPPSLTKGGDDLVSSFDYQGATAASGGLWTLKSTDASKAQIAKDLEVTGGASFTGNVDLSGGATAQLKLGAASMMLPNQATLVNCNAANVNLIRINNTNDPNTVEICDDDDDPVGGPFTWVNVAAGATAIGLWKNDGVGGPAEIYYNVVGGNVGIGTADPDDALDVVGVIGLTDNLEMAATKSILWTGGAGITENTGALQINANGGVGVELTASASAVTIVGNTRITGTTTGVTAVDGLIVEDSGGADILVVQNDGKVGIGDSAPDDALNVVGEVDSTMSYKIDDTVVLKTDTTMGGTILVGADAGANVTGDTNTVVGAAAAVTLVDGEGNIIIGNAVDAFAADQDDSLNIGNIIQGDLSGHRVGVGFSAAVDVTTFDDALEVSGNIDATGIVHADDDVTATDDITATDDLVAGSQVMVNGAQLGPPDECTSDKKLTWDDVTGWDCIDDMNDGSGGGGPQDLEEVLTEGDDAGDLEAVNFGGIAIGDTALDDGSGSGGQELVLDVTGALGGDYFCDSDGLNCFTAASIAGGGTPKLNVLTAANGPNTIASGDNAQIWNWTLTTAGKSAFTFGEAAAAINGVGAQSVLKAAALANSTAMPFWISNAGNAYSFRVDDVAGDTTPFIIDSAGRVGIGGAPTVPFHVTAGVTAAAGSGVASRFAQTLDAAANSDALTALYINPTFNDGAFTGVTHNSLIIASGNVGIGDTTPDDGTGGGGQALLVDVEGATGSAYYCDEDGLNCFTATSVTGGNNIWERNGTVVRTKVPVVYTTDDLVFGSPTLADDTDPNHDARVYFDKSKAAFRAGIVDGAQWDAANAGTASAAFGNNTTASGDYSLAAGTGSTASVTAATALGANTIASATGAFAVGITTEASGDGSMSLGSHTIASGADATALGLEAVAGSGTTGDGKGDTSLAIGLGNSSAAGSAEYPKVEGVGSLGIFMGDQKNVNIAANNILALMGGRIVLDPDTTSAANVNVSTGVQQLELDVEGDVGAVNYCDKDGNNCFTPANVGHNTRISDLLVANQVNTIDNTLHAQTWNWSTLSSETALALTASGTTMTSGKLLNVTSASTGLTGQLGNFDLTGNHANNTGSVLRTSVSGAATTGTPLMVTNLGAGLSMRVNDATGDTDATPFIIDTSGNVAIGSTAAEARLEVQNDEGNDATFALDADDGDDAADTWFIKSLAASNDLSILNDTTERIRLSATGSLGIGDFSSDTIDSALHIQTGDIRLDGGAANQAGCFRFDDTTDKLQFSNDCASFTDLSGATGATPKLNSIIAADNTNSIDSLNYAQTWAWSTLAGSAMTLSSTSTAAAGGLQKILNIALSGTNGTAGQTTYGLDVSNTHDGGTSTDIAIRGTATGGTTANYGVYGTTATSLAASYGVYGSNTSTAGLGYGVYSAGALGVVPVAPTIADGAAAEYSSGIFTAPTITLGGATQVTAQMDSFIFNPPTITRGGATTVDNSTTMTIAGVPVKAGSAVLTSVYGLKINTNASAAVNAYGLHVTAPSGATNNYAALFSGNVMGTPPATQTIAAGNVITANACGTVKALDAGGAVSTDATTPFTAGVAANAGCCMDVVNVDTADTITVKYNATNFKSSTAADIALAPTNSIRVCSNGTTWYQVQDKAAGTPGGSDKYVQFNDGGSFGGDSDFQWDKTTNILSVTGKITVSDRINIAGSTGNAAVAMAQDDLSDTIISTPSNGECITYNGTNWVDGSCAGGGIPLNSISAATASQAGIANGAYTIVWNWDTLAGGSAMKFASTSTAATGGTQKMFEVALSGTNGTAGQSTWAIDASNTHAGATSTNYGVRGTATGGTSANYALYGSATGVTGNDYGVYSAGALGVVPVAPTIADGASAEYSSGIFTAPTITLGGATQVTAQMDSFIFNPPTITRGGATTVDNSTTMTIAGVPVKAGSAVLTSVYGLKINTNASAAVNAYGLHVTAPSGATNNYAALFSGNVLNTPPAAAALAGGGVIPADACGAIKQLFVGGSVGTNTGDVTTDTTNTFTAPGTTNTGCCMDVANVETAGGTDDITLDNNTNFRTAGAADITLNPGDMVRVCSNGTNWYQVKDKVGGSSAHGSDKYVQFNDGGTSLGSDSDFQWDKTANTLTINGRVNYVPVTGAAVPVTPSGVSAALSSLTAATVTNTIANANNAQVWNWDTLAGVTALKLGSTSTAGAGNAQKMLEIALSGNNAVAGQTTYGAYITNTHATNTSTNVGLYASASGGATANYAALFAAGNVGIGTTAPVESLHIGEATGGGLLLNREDATTTSGELLGELLFDATDGQSTTDASAAIRGYSSTTAATTDKGGYLSFLTKADTTDNNAAATERLRLTSAGSALFTTAVTTGTAGTAGMQLLADALTTGNGMDVSSTSLTTGNLVKLASTGTAANSDTQTVLNIATSGANANAGQTTYGLQVTNTHSTNTSENIAIYASASGGATANYAALFAAGNVGIGTVTPTKILNVGEATGANVLLSREDATTTSGELLGQILFDSTDGASTTDASALIQGYASIAHATTDKGGYITFSTKADTTDNNAAATERMRIAAGGNVGIGTLATAPEALLEVQGVEATDAVIALDADDGDDAADTWFLESEAADNDLSIVNGVTETFKISSAGLVGLKLVAGNAPTDGIGWKRSGTLVTMATTTDTAGIGTTNPNQGKLEVKGGSVCVDTNSDDNATSCIANESDVRLKKNVQSLDYSLDTLMNLRPVSFDWRYNDPEILKHYPLLSRFESQPHSIGFIAQDVQKLVPEAIESETVGDKDVQYLQLDYTKLVPVVVKAVQQLKGAHDGLAKKVQQAFDLAQQAQKDNVALKAEVSTLKAANDNMKTAMNDMAKDIDGLKAHTNYGIGKAEFTPLMLIGIGATGGLSVLFFFLGGALRNRKYPLK